MRSISNSLTTHGLEEEFLDITSLETDDLDIASFTATSATITTLTVSTLDKTIGTYFNGGRSTLLGSTALTSVDIVTLAPAADFTGKQVEIDLSCNLYSASTDGMDSFVLGAYDTDATINVAHGQIFNTSADADYTNVRMNVVHTLVTNVVKVKIQASVADKLYVQDVCVSVTPL